MKKFSKILKELRIEKNMTQRQVAEILKIKQQSYLQYEQNKCEPSQEILIKLARIFAVTVGELLGEEEE